LGFCVVRYGAEPVELAHEGKEYLYVRNADLES
jgi:hypothetical protein